MFSSLLKYQNILFIIFAILIPLLIYAIFIQWKTLKKIRTEKEQKKKEILEAQGKRQSDLQESLRIIAMATIQEQCEISEACLRLANLLPLYDEIDHKEERWAPLFIMYEEIRELKTLETRNNLKAAERFQEDKKRFASEEKYHSEIITICENLYALTKEQNKGSL